MDGSYCQKNPVRRGVTGGAARPFQPAPQRSMVQAPHVLATKDRVVLPKY